MRKAFSETVISYLSRDKYITVFLGDIGVANFEETMKLLPNQIINIGIMEQSMISIAAGVSKAGHFPIIHSIAPFIVERGYEQLKIDFGYNQQKGLIVTTGASFDYSSLGSTHHCPNDVLLVGLIPGFDIYMPGNVDEVSYATSICIEDKSLAYIRLSAKEHTLNLGQFAGFRKIRSGKLASLIVVGSMLKIVEQKISELDFDIYYINAFTAELVNLNLSQDKKIIILEDLTEGTNLFLLNKIGVRFEQNYFSIGVPVSFAKNFGTTTDLMADFGLSIEAIENKIELFLVRTI